MDGGQVYKFKCEASDITTKTTTKNVNLRSLENKKKEFFLLQDIKNET
jgi:hypothetical protein